MPGHQVSLRPVLRGIGQELSNPHIPTYTLAAFRRCHPSGWHRCGNCGELVRLTSNEVMIENTSNELESLGQDVVVQVKITHDYVLDAPVPVFAVPAGQCPVTHRLVYEDGTREAWVRNGEGRYERLYGIVYRDAASLTESAAPQPVYREVWYPTGEFRAPAETPPDSRSSSEEWDSLCEDDEKRAPRSVRRPVTPKHEIHEIIVERLPRPSPGNTAESAWSMPTVAEYRARLGSQVDCFFCKEMLDIPGLDRVLAAWDPEATFSISFQCVPLPSDPPDVPLWPNMK